MERWLRQPRLRVRATSGSWRTFVTAGSRERASPAGRPADPRHPRHGAREPRGATGFRHGTVGDDGAATPKHRPRHIGPREILRGTMPRPEAFSHDVVVIGGCGHVGLPLAIALADPAPRSLVYDVSEAAVDLVNDGELPFDEPGADDKLKDGRRRPARCAPRTDPAVVGQAENVVVVIGTPVDEHLNPDPQAIPRALDGCARALPRRPAAGPAQHRLPRRHRGWWSGWSPTAASTSTSSFCPERIAEGKAMTELYTLPQIVSGRDQREPASGPRRCSAGSPSRSSSWSRRRPSWPSCSPTPGATSSSPRPTSST